MAANAVPRGDPDSNHEDEEDPEDNRRWVGFQPQEVRPQLDGRRSRIDNKRPQQKPREELDPEGYRLRWLGYTPSARQPNLANIKPSIDNRWSKSANDVRKVEDDDNDSELDDGEEEEYRIRWLGYTPSARQPNLANIKPSIDNRRTKSTSDLRKNDEDLDDELSERDEEEYRIRWLGYTPSARQPDLASISPSVDDRNPEYERKWREKQESDKNKRTSSALSHRPYWNAYARMHDGDRDVITPLPASGRSSRQRRSRDEDADSVSTFHVAESRQDTTTTTTTLTSMSSSRSSSSSSSSSRRTSVSSIMSREASPRGRRPMSPVVTREDLNMTRTIITPPEERVITNQPQSGPRPPSDPLDNPALSPLPPSSRRPSSQPPPYSSWPPSPPEEEVCCSAPCCCGLLCKCVKKPKPGAHRSHKKHHHHHKNRSGPPHQNKHRGAHKPPVTKRNSISRHQVLPAQEQHNYNNETFTR